MARRHDPDRARRIADAAVRVISREGVNGLSHRAVAAEADVPLGSTTYHYTSLDDLLLAALRQVNDGWLARFARWTASVDPAVPLADELAHLAVTSLTEHRAQCELEYELYFAGLRRPAVRPLAAECLDSMAELLRGLVPDEQRARAVVGLLDGTLLHLLLTGRPPHHGELRAVFARLVPEDETGSPAVPDAG